MQDYSDIVYLMGAMIVFSMASLQASHMMVVNEKQLTEAKIEYHAIGLGQDYIDQIKWINTSADLNNFIAGYPKTVNVDYGSSGSLPFYVDFNVKDYPLPGSNVTNKLVTIIIKSKYIGNDVTDAKDSPRAIKLNYLKSF